MWRLRFEIIGDRFQGEFEKLKPSEIPDFPEEIEEENKIIAYYDDVEGPEVRKQLIAMKRCLEAIDAGHFYDHAQIGALYCALVSQYNNKN